MLHDIKDRKLSPRLTKDQLKDLTPLGETIDAADREIIQSEGDPVSGIFVILSGRVRAFRRVAGADELIGLFGVGEFSGDLSVLTGGSAKIFLQSSGGSTLLKLSIQTVRKLVVEGSPLSETLIAAMTQRARHSDSQMVQEEKLAALGKMAAGLAHELNNPATAARRASKLMLEAVLETPLRMLSYDSHYTPEERKLLREFATLMIQRLPNPACDSLEMSDREQELQDWLEENGIPRSDEVAPIFAESGVSTGELSCWHGRMGCNFVNGLYWLETVIRLSSLARDIESSTNRIAELVGALKEYSYMDQARFQEIDVRKGIESTLKIMHHKLKNGVEVRRDFGPDLPKICAYAGELNQVWTNLIDNAVDAMEGHGVLTLAIRGIPDGVVVEIGDTGKGIPKDIIGRIYEPFFTTKPQGKGTGLGLDITYRVVVYRHGGSIGVRSKPGETVFTVQLPIKPPREEDIVAALDEEEAANKQREAV
jgi:signal transduction histidine kinase